MLHSTFMVMFLATVVIIGTNYRWFWYRTEFWIKDKAARRPYTFILRDFYHLNPLVTCFLLVWAGYGLGRWLFSFENMLLLSAGLLFGHLFWGPPYQPGEQENPAYDPDGDRITLTQKGRKICKL